MTEVNTLEEVSKQFEEALLSLDRIAAQRIYQEAQQIYSPLELAEHLIGLALFRIGEGWEAGRVALSQVYMSGRVCEELVGGMAASVAENGRRAQPRMAIAVLEDHHALGKRIVQTALAAAGYHLNDYGIGVPVARLVEHARQDQIEVLLISTLMFRSALLIEKVTAQLPDVQVIVGGAPFLFDTTLWQKVGARAMGRSSGDAIALVGQLTEELR